VLDPIDGTRGFVGMRQYAVCLGMLQVRRYKNSHILINNECDMVGLQMHKWMCRASASCG
jgi:3'-phosphoadenosine 5'-phosphosulfate (PAPS) 3'-phosphatase